MKKTFLKIGLGMLALAGMAWPSQGAVTGMKTLPGHVPAVVSKMAVAGAVDPTNTLHLAIGLPLHNQEQLSKLLKDVSDPASPSYRQYLTSEEFAAQFGPTEADSQAVIAFANANGMTVKKVHSNRMLVEVEAPVSKVEQAFNVKLHSYHLAAQNRDFYAPDQEPTVPSALPVLDVQGLDNYVQARPRLHHAPTKQTSTRLGSGPLGTFMGNDFRPAYVPGSTLTGTGQKVALVEFDGYLASDITAYLQRSGLPSVALTNVLLRGFSGTPFDPNSQGEVTLDIDMVAAIAPGIGQIVVYEDNPQAAYIPNIVLNQIAVDNSARQISCSWGWTGGPSSTTDQIFQQMILQGQSFFDASGDVCAFLPPGSPGSVDDPTLFNAPSDDPYITQVGGTTLQTTGPGGSYVSETVWNWGIEFPGFGLDGVGSSGGISGYYTIPTWQQGVSMANNQGSTTHRNLPDVAMTADNIFIIVNSVDEAGVGGTSAAAPLWAGFTALINQQAAARGLGAVGFLNPALYAIATNSVSYTNCFRDVVTGNNTWLQSTNEFYAVTGFDLCTGLGSPNGTNLINTLATALYAPIVYTPVIPAPKQPWGNTLSVMNGSDPNGLWFLYYQDDKLNNYSGTNYNGWAVNLTTANPVGLAADNQLYVNTTINSQPYGNATNVIATPGAIWHTTLAVTNYGQALSSNVFVSDTLPVSPGVTLASWNSSIPSSTVAVVGPTLTWSVGNLPVNTGGVLNLNFQVNNTGVYTNSGTVGALTTDPNPDDDSVMVIANVAVTTQPVMVPLLAVDGSHAFKLSITNDAGANIIIQASTNLTSWIPVCTNVAPFTFTNFDVTNFQKRFYRATIGQ